MLGQSKLLRMLLVVAPVAAVAPLYAHHLWSSTAEYRADKLETVTGTLTKVEWSNPHVTVQVETRDSAGRATAWTFEGYPPNTLKRGGFAREMLKEGERITVTFFPAANGAPRGLGRQLVFADGTNRFLGPASLDGATAERFVKGPEVRATGNVAAAAKSK